MGIMILLIVQALVALWGINWIVHARKRCFPEYKASWRFQLLGLILIVSGTLGMAGLSYWGVTVVGTILFSTLYVCGLFLFLAGLSRWLVPVLESAQQGQAYLRKLSFLKKLSQKLDSSTDVYRISKKALEELCQSAPFEAGAVYYRSPLALEMHLTGSLKVEDYRLPITLNQSDWLKSYPASFSKLELAISLAGQNFMKFKRAIPVPLRKGSQRVGLAWLWPTSQQDGSAQIDSSLLDMWGTSLASALQSYRHQQLKSMRQKTIATMSRVADLLDNSDSLEQLFPKLASLLKEVVDYHILCLAVLDKSGKNMERYTVGTTGNLLWEKGVGWSTCGSVVAKVFQTKRMIIEDDLTKTDQEGIKGIPMFSGCRSRLALALSSGARVWGVVIFGHRDPKHFHPISGRSAKLVLHHLTYYLALRELQGGIAKRDKLLGLLEQLTSQLSREQSLETRLKNITEMVSTSLPVTSCRVSVLEENQNLLRTVTEFNLRNRTEKSSSSGSLSLAELPWHRLALLSRKPMLVNQNDPESMMPEAEIKAAFARPVNSALLVPLVSGESVIGLLSMAEERDWNRRPFSYPEVQAAELVADHLVNLILQSKRDFSRKKGLVSESIYPAAWISELRRQLSDPVCGILGASELILAKQTNLEPDFLRYVQIIHRMAQRIEDSVKQESYSFPNHQTHPTFQSEGSVTGNAQED